ncbi:MAG TPA: GNAT family protein [Acidimicrobiales bacterium]|nr:GNAT family protein [Acidimicrobiales bacterium]
MSEVGGPGGEMRAGLARYFPPFGLRVVTPRLMLALPTDEDLLALVEVTNAGVHDPASMPFLVPWTDTPAPRRQFDSLTHWWGVRAHWSATNWNWAAAVYVDGHPIGVQSVFAHDFAARRQVGTASWIGLAHQGQGFGQEMRSAALQLAFEGLGAIMAHSGYLEHNAASRRVSSALGYRANGTSLEPVRGALVRQHNVVLERDAWEVRRRDDVVIEGLDGCRSYFGVP